MSKIDELQEALVKRRTVILFGKIDSESAERCRFWLMSFAAGSDSSIELLIDSGGGSVMQAFAIVDTIALLRTRGVEVDGIVVGVCMSAAVNVLQACRRRQATENSLFLVHQIDAEMRLPNVDDVETLRERFEIELKLNEFRSRKTNELLALRTGKRVEEIEEARRRGHKYDDILTPQEALEFGLIDEIVSSMPPATAARPSES